MIIDSSGDLYGTTNGGGASGHGTVFELVNSSATYAEKVLYSFGSSLSDGWYPVARLLMDASGNLYGTTEAGGNSTACGGYPCGTVFELINSAAGYTHQVLYSFQGSDGQMPAAGLITDSAGDLFGTTEGGGSSTLCGGGGFGCGTVFELVKSSGGYSERVLYSFGSDSTLADGVNPEGDLIMDASGNLYGTTKWGGSGCAPQGCGIVFELVNSAGAYAEKVLHYFGAPGDGEGPSAALAMDSGGNLYGTTDVGGATLGSGGTAFQVNPTAVAPVATLSTVNITFANQPIQTASPTQTVTVTNSGSADLIFGPGAVTLSGSNAGDFTVSADTCSGTAVVPAAACTANVVFSPTTVGTKSATVNFADNASTSPQTVALSGTGVLPPAVALSPASLAFTSQTLNTRSGVQTLSVLNSGGANLNFAAGSITISGKNAADFAIVSNGCNGATVPPASPCSVGITFAPSIIGAETATLSLADNAAGSPQTVSLTGTGVASSTGSGSLPQNETVLYSFGGPAAGGSGADGARSYAGLISDGSGNLYGTTGDGGTAGLGSVFELVNSSGSYTEKLLYSFAGPAAGESGADGAYPTSRLILDSSGNLFGTTQLGGASGNGTVFELVNSSGTYTEKILYSFMGTNGDGSVPFAGLYMDSAGNLYGTTKLGGGTACTLGLGCGTVFELVSSPTAPGTYTENVLYRFTGVNGDGALPHSGLTADDAGNLYGTTSVGGQDGTVYELVNSSGCLGSAGNGMLPNLSSY